MGNQSEFISLPLRQRVKIQKGMYGSVAFEVRSPTDIHKGGEKNRGRALQNFSCLTVFATFKSNYLNGHSISLSFTVYYCFGPLPCRSSLVRCCSAFLPKISITFQIPELQKENKTFLLRPDINNELIEREVMSYTCSFLSLVLCQK